jgi:hypothetical protein
MAEPDQDDIRKALALLRLSDPYLAERIGDALSESPTERMLRRSLEAMNAHMQQSMDSIRAELAQFRKDMNTMGASYGNKLIIVVLVALLLQSALVLGTLTAKLPFLELATKGAP